MKKSSVGNELHTAIRRLHKAKERARRLGMFTDERELLACPSCGLWEDVTIEGILITYPKDDLSQEDSGLRFRHIDESHFECPVCGATLTVEDEDGLL